MARTVSIRTRIPLYVRNTILCTLAFMAGNIVYGTMFPIELPPEIRQRYDQFQEGRDEYDVIFIGSSYTFRHVDPDLFDTVLLERGLSIRSFNFGIRALQFHEGNALLRLLLDSEPKKLKYVFIGASLPGPTFPEPYWFTQRVVWWHDLAETLSVCSRVVAIDEPLLFRAELLAKHAVHWAMRFAHLGNATGAFAAPATLFTPFTEYELASMLDRRGYAPLKEYGQDMPESERAAEREAYRAVLEEFRLARESAPVVSRSDERAFEEQSMALERLGLTPIYFVEPTVFAVPEVTRFAEVGIIRTLFEFNDPAAYPALYEFDVRYGYGHMVEPGAREFTTLLASRFADYLEELR